ncbi:hypothetical protein [uncultured Idiomarina sp.]|uniref:hypothetical protein n=1 Tax=uncultured Idiomarina sp. TaxID=352961 RepID=UPI0032B1B4AD|tara:strand:- start:5961 stop:6317 length:357 start_codon:yes stop_codon:yes gene_type:complete
MEMIIKGITAHSPDGCATGEDVLKFFDQNPRMHYEIKDGKAIYKKSRSDDLGKGITLYQYDAYEVDIDVLNINKIFDCDAWSMIETKDGKVHLVEYWGSDIAIMLLKSANIGWQGVGF